MCCTVTTRYCAVLQRYGHTYRYVPLTWEINSIEFITMYPRVCFCGCNFGGIISGRDRRYVDRYLELKVMIGTE